MKSFVKNRPTKEIDEKVQNFISHCKEQGLKVTHQRLEIYREILLTKNHPSAEEVYRRVVPKLPTISLDTVYRTLAFFEKHGLINRLHHLDDRSRYDPNTNLHHHLVCKYCNTVEDFYWPGFDKLEPPEATKTWGTIHNKMVEVTGICQSCLKKMKKET